ncbi:MAG: AbrB/MazE/SpoVT family DNA-binding domain-containing protein [Enterobacteriaceae bacterium]|jgi:antitoxin component of MazEF toxin-antitoxin module|nr:AbrB/MazE/SpoVT family DNA-binding domain-containing protein [Enterobacteriaceae bacterium]
MSIAIKKWGNSQGIIIPTHILNKIGLKIGEALDIQVDSGKIILTPKQKRKIFSESDLLADINEHNAHSDELAIITSTESG